jgi:hypothetical protein
MNATALKTLAALVPACLLLGGSAILFFSVRTASTLLQLVGSACLTVVVLTHICEAFD